MHILTTPHINADGSVNGAVLIKKYKVAREIFSQLYDECIANGIIVGNKFRVTSSEVIEKVSEFLQIPVPAIKCKSRRRNLVEARMICYHIMYNYSGLTLTQIGRLFGNRDHTTILHALQSYNDWMFSDKAFANKAKACEELILNRPDND